MSLASPGYSSCMATISTKGDAAVVGEAIERKVWRKARLVRLAVAQTASKGGAGNDLGSETS